MDERKHYALFINEEPAQVATICSTTPVMISKFLEDWHLIAMANTEKLLLEVKEVKIMPKELNNEQKHRKISCSN